MKATQKAIKKAIKEGSTAVYKLAKQCGIDVSNKSLILDLLNQVDYMNNKKVDLVYGPWKIKYADDIKRYDGERYSFAILIASTWFDFIKEKKKN